MKSSIQQPCSAFQSLQSAAGRRIFSSCTQCVAIVLVATACNLGNAADALTLPQTAFDSSIAGNSWQRQSQSLTRQQQALSPLDRRVALLAKELNLNADQRIQVRGLLQSQRVQVSRVWSNDSLPAAVRVKATQLISERTADQIRALLSDEQRKLYSRPVPQSDDLATSSVKLDDWMGKAESARASH